MKDLHCVQDPIGIVRLETVPNAERADTRAIYVDVDTKSVQP